MKRWKAEVTYRDRSYEGTVIGTGPESAARRAMSAMRKSGTMRGRRISRTAPIVVKLFYLGRVGKEEEDA